LHPAVSRTGNKLAYARVTTDVDLWRLEDGGPVPIASSTLNEMNPEFSPDSKRIVFVSDRGGRGGEIWVAQADGSGPTRIVQASGRLIGGPRWSPDGSFIAYDARKQDGTSAIYVVDSSGGLSREVTSQANVPTWSRDGKWLYFGSRRSGSRQVWRIPASGGSATQITSEGGVMGWESWDRALLYYTRDGALYSKPLAGGPEQKVIESLVYYGFYPSKSGIYHIVQPDPRTPHSYELRLLSFAFGQRARTQVLYRFESLGSSYLFTVSPDERTVLVDGISPAKNDDLMLIQNFR
jgi:dipeptidyl aminopeptidase/acylaminoacyl peptidase